MRDDTLEYLEKARKHLTEAKKWNYDSDEWGEAVEATLDALISAVKAVERDLP